MTLNIFPYIIHIYFFLHAVMITLNFLILISPNPVETKTNSYRKTLQYKIQENQK